MSADLSLLSELATQRDGEKRRQLLSRIADMFYNNAQDTLSDRSVELFTKLVSRLLRDLDRSGRAEFSLKVAADERTPRQVVLQLARDDPAVAEPVLTRSPLLLDDDLVAIAMNYGIEHRLAISKREGITEAVTDALRVYDEPAVLGTIIENVTALITRTGFEHIFERALGDPGLLKKLSSRGDLPTELADKILPLLAPEDRERLNFLMEVDGAGVENQVREVLAELSGELKAGANNRIQVKALVREVERGGRSVESAIGTLLDAGRELDVALALSLLTGLTQTQTTNALISTQVEPLAVICKSLSLPPMLYVRVDDMRASSVNLPSISPGKLMKVYSEVEVESARRALRFVQVRNSVGAAQAS